MSVVARTCVRDHGKLVLKRIRDTPELPHLTHYLQLCVGEVATVIDSTNWQI